ncbi:unnamed protein product, partial [Prorocentrum cordatum]
APAGPAGGDGHVDVGPEMEGKGDATETEGDFRYHEDENGHKYFRHISLHRYFHKVSGAFNGWGKCTKTQTVHSDGGSEGARRRLHWWGGHLGGTVHSKAAHEDRWAKVITDWGADSTPGLAVLEVDASQEF